MTGGLGERAGAIGGGAANLNKSALSVARIGGAATGVGIFAAGVFYARYQDNLSAEDAARVLGEDLKADFRQVNPEAYERFAEAIDRQTDIQGVTQVLADYYQTGQLTDEMIDTFAPDAKTLTVSPYPGVSITNTIQPASANPFSDENFAGGEYGRGMGRSDREK